MPMNSDAPRRSMIRSGDAVSRPSPESTMNRIGWNVVSAVISVATGREHVTETPSVTSLAARTRASGVMRFRVPSWSSAPQRPQFDSVSIIFTTSCSLGTWVIARPRVRGPLSPRVHHALRATSPVASGPVSVAERRALGSQYYTMASTLLPKDAMAGRRRATTTKPTDAPAHDTPTLGPRRRPRKVRPSPPRTPRGHDDHPGAKPPAHNPYIDEGEPEVNG